MNIARNDRTDARRLVEAAAWRTHLTETDQESTPAFEAWLVAEDANQRAWERVQQSWNSIGEQATSPELLDLRRKALSQARAVSSKRWLAATSFNRYRHAAIAAGLCLLVVGGLVAANIIGADTYRTAAGERRVVRLSDGSRVQLDSLTELRVDYSKRARELKLLKGQARFDVAHDVERPFSVLAAGQKVVATGTAFNVDLLDRNLFVTLIEGKVVIVPQAAPSRPAPTLIETSASRSGSEIAQRPPPRAAVRVRRIELAAGQQFAVAENGASIVAVANVQRATAWQSGQLVFDDEPLSSVVARVNRYAARPLSLADERTAALRISGVFNTGDVDGFVSTITHYLPIEAEQIGEDIRLSAKPQS